MQTQFCSCPQILHSNYQFRRKIYSKVKQPQSNCNNPNYKQNINQILFFFAHGQGIDTKKKFPNQTQVWSLKAYMQRKLSI